MPFYFSSFNTVEYDLKKNDKPVVLTNITNRYKIKKLLQDKGVVFYDYYVKDSDRPDIIAQKFYGDGSLDWIIFLTNDIVDPYYDWPMTNDNFNNFIKSKYGSLSAAQGTVHHYEQILRASSIHTDGTIIPEKSVIVDLTTYNSLAGSSRRIVHQYEHEEKINNDKREIKLLDQRYVQDVVSEAKTIYDEQ
jgi:hypothetical protein